jgi:hypothetical protein
MRGEGRRGRAEGSSAMASGRIVRSANSDRAEGRSQERRPFELLGGIGEPLQSGFRIAYVISGPFIDEADPDLWG